MDQGAAPQSVPSEGMAVISRHRWLDEDLAMLKSGLFADAEIMCEDHATPRKVHRAVLAARSTWFKRAFSGDFKEASECKVNLQETAWRVDLMLYFFYTGGIDMKNETLMSGHDKMDIGVELLRLGDFFQSADMCLYGKSILDNYLNNLLPGICGTGPSSSNNNKERFAAEGNFPQRFCGAVTNAFDRERPVRAAQDILADFAFLARLQLYQDTEFVAFIKDEVSPEFGNLVLAAEMTGASLSGVFKNNPVFQRWKDWRVVTQSQTPPPQSSTTGRSNPFVIDSGNSISTSLFTGISAAGGTGNTTQGSFFSGGSAASGSGNAAQGGLFSRGSAASGSGNATQGGLFGTVASSGRDTGRVGGSSTSTGATDGGGARGQRGFSFLGTV